MQSTAIAEAEFTAEKDEGKPSKRFFYVFRIDSIEKVLKLLHKEMQKVTSSLILSAPQSRDRIWELESTQKIKKALNIIDKEGRITGTLP